jgi:hypothetical protein
VSERLAGPLVRHMMRGALTTSMHELAATLDSELAQVNRTGA